MTEARTYMDGYSDGREWAGATSQAQPSQAGLSDAEIDAIEAAVIAKLCAGVEMPEPISYVSFNRQGDISRIIKRKDSWTNTPVFTADQLRTAIAAARVKAYAAAGASPVEPSQTPNFCESCAMDLVTCDCVSPRPVLVNQLPSAWQVTIALHALREIARGAQMDYPHKMRLDEVATVAKKAISAFNTAQPSQAQPPAPSEAAREYMTGYSDAKEWAGATNQAQPSQAGLSDAEIDAIGYMLFSNTKGGPTILQARTLSRAIIVAMRMTKTDSPT